MNDLIIDGNSAWARSFYAAKEDPEKAKTLFIYSILQLLDQEEGKFGVPIHRTLFAWDGRAKTDKGRKPKPASYGDTRYQVQEALLTLFDTVHGYHPDYEGDDVAATAAFNSEANQVFIVSGDHDLMQLQGGNIAYYCLNTKSVLPARVICRKFAVKRPSQIAISLAILGDRGDGVAGVHGWGPKRVESVFEAVTEQMSFAEALEAVQRQIPERLLPDFLDSLDKTLLFTNVPGIPQPRPLAFCTNQQVLKTGIEKIAGRYERIALQYEGEDAMEAMLKK